MLWRIDATNEADTWLPVWASVWHGPGHGTQGQIFPWLPYQVTPVPHLGQRVEVDMRPFWEWVVCGAVLQVVTTVSWLTFAVARQSRYLRSGALVIAGQYAIIAAMRAIAGVGLWIRGYLLGAG